MGEGGRSTSRQTGGVRVWMLSRLVFGFGGFFIISTRKDEHYARGSSEDERVRA